MPAGFVICALRVKFFPVSVEEKHLKLRKDKAFTQTFWYQLGLNKNITQEMIILQLPSYKLLEFQQ